MPVLARAPDERSIETKPHGHGDVHFLLHTSGLAQRWLSQGLSWVCFFQVRSRSRSLRGG